MEKTNGQKAWELNKIIMDMNNEDAYYGSWLYLWPDDCSREECEEYFKGQEEYDELEELFIDIYKIYHKDGLYTKVKEIVELAHLWDKKLGLKEIENYYG